ncbi:MAG: hypothetical protein H6558_10160 [Lewinellaceae bacterium]|nr:hypothetical protein [Lewinellaceae bacterium]
MNIFNFINRKTTLCRFIFKLKRIIAGIIFLCILTACDKWDLGLISFPEINSLHFEGGRNPSEGALFGEINGFLENKVVDNHGHVWSENQIPPPSIDDNIGQALFGQKGNGTFKSELTGLTPGRTYYYRAYIITDGEVKYGSIKQFTTPALPFSLSIDTIIIIQEAEFTVKVRTSFSGLPVGLEIKSYGLVWDKKPELDINTGKVVRVQGLIVSESTMEFQFENTIQLEYDENFLRPYFIVGDTTLYGAVKPKHFQDIWIPRANLLAEGRQAPVGFSIGRKGYLGTGWDYFNDIRKDFWEYDPITDNWTQKADFGGGPRWNAVGFSIGPKGYAGTGEGNDDVLFKDFWEYDPQTDTWVPLADLPAEERSAAVGFSIGNKGFLGTGEGYNEIHFKDFWQYNPQNDSWEQSASLPGIERNWAIGFSIREKGYLGTGGKGSSNLQKDFWEYNPDMDMWTPLADFPGTPRTAAVGFSIDSMGYIGLGFSGSIEKDFWEYDPQTNSWSSKGDFEGGSRTLAVGFSIDSYGYVGMGFEGVSFGTMYRDLWIYVPQ